MAKIPPFDTNLPPDSEFISMFPHWIRTLEEAFNQLLAQSVTPGTVRTGYFYPIPDGWLVAKSGFTVGKSGTVANYANDEYFELFKALWGGANVESAIMYTTTGVVVDTRVNVQSDWDAGNRITIPTLTNKMLRGAQDENPVNAGVYGGTDSLQLHAKNLPPFYVKTSTPTIVTQNIDVTDDVNYKLGDSTKNTSYPSDGNIYYRDEEGNEVLSINEAFDNRAAFTTLMVIIKY